MSIDFRSNTNDGIPVNSLRTIRSIILHITSMKSGTGVRFGLDSGDVIQPINIGSINLFDRGTLYFYYSSILWHGTSKSEVGNPEGNSIFKDTGRENNFEVEKLVTRIL